MQTREHFAWPFQVTSQGTVATVEQDTDEEIETAMAIILSWPQGTRPSDPMFGVDEQAFLAGGPDLGELRAAITAYEPRALARILDSDETLTQFVATVRVGYSPVGQEPEL